MKLGPVSFLFTVAIGWVAARALILWPGAPRPVSPPLIAWQPPLSRPDPLKATEPPTRRERITARTAKAQPWEAPEAPAASLAPAILAVPQATLVAFTRFPPAVSTPIHPPVVPRSEGHDRKTWRGSAWAILRQTARGEGLAAAGQLGGAQAGARVSHDLGSGLAIAARVSGPLASGRGKEAAIAIDWRPVAGLPLTLTLERRAGLDAGGRDAFAAGVFGGFDSVRVPGNARLDGYVQAGAVGLRRRDAYIDGAFRIERPIARQGGLEISAGAGLWGGAQPGVARLDTGPQIVAHVPVGPARLRIGAEWRARIAGNARPGSGPVLTIGADF